MVTFFISRTEKIKKSKKFTLMSDFPRMKELSTKQKFSFPFIIDILFKFDVQPHQLSLNSFTFEGIVIFSIDDRENASFPIECSSESSEKSTVFKLLH